MAREPQGYRENLQAILEFSGGKHLLNVQDVCRFTGLTYRTVKSRYPFIKNYISAASLAQALTGEKR